jgi:hypothetical protein
VNGREIWEEGAPSVPDDGGGFDWFRRGRAGTNGAAAAAIVGDEAVHRGKVKLEVPPLVENGNTVALTVFVDSPMMEKEHVKSLHIG